jgi:integrase
MVIMDNNVMATDPMLDTLYLFQPRGPGTAYLFRMPTPAALVGKTNPRTGKPYGREIREGLGGARRLVDARKQRDLRLGLIRAEEAQANGAVGGSLKDALSLAAELRNVGEEEREIVAEALIDRAEELEKKVGEKRAVRWYKTATGAMTPFTAACEQYKADRGKALSRSTLNNLDTAIREFKEFAGKDVSLQEVDIRLVARFVTEYLPNKKSPKAPQGQGPATIRKKVSQLSQVWSWAQKRGLLPKTKETPWDDQAPTKDDVRAVAVKRRPLTADEAVKLLDAAPAGDALGDVIRVALLTGVRLEEIAGLDASQVAEDARWYTIRKGKTESAARVVPLVAAAQEVVKSRLERHQNGPLFPEVRVRKSTGRRGGAQSGRPVAIAAAEHDPDHPPPIGFGRRDKQRVSSGPRVVHLRPCVHADVAGFQQHVMIWRRDVDPSGLDCHSVFGEDGGVPEAITNDARKNARMSADVHDDENRRLVTDREKGEDFVKRLKTACRGRDDHDRVSDFLVCRHFDPVLLIANAGNQQIVLPVRRRVSPTSQ